jgi:hypothetical protein
MYQLQSCRTKQIAKGVYAHQEGSFRSDLFRGPSIVNQVLVSKTFGRNIIIRSCRKQEGERKLGCRGLTGVTHFLVDELAKLDDACHCHLRSILDSRGEEMSLRISALLPRSMSRTSVNGEGQSSWKYSAQLPVRGLHSHVLTQLRSFRKICMHIAPSTSKLDGVKLTTASLYTHVRGMAELQTCGNSIPVCHSFLEPQSRFAAFEHMNEPWPCISSRYVQRRREPSSKSRWCSPNRCC